MNNVKWLINVLIQPDFILHKTFHFAAGNGSQLLKLLFQHCHHRIKLGIIPSQLLLFHVLVSQYPEIQLCVINLSSFVLSSAPIVVRLCRSDRHWFNLIK
jgi:hypothetical protein